MKEHFCDKCGSKTEIKTIYCGSEKETEIKVSTCGKCRNEKVI